MVDFSELYKRPAGEAKRPATWPAGLYKGRIKSMEKVRSRQKKTPGIKYYCTLTEFPPDVQEEWTETDEDGKVWRYSRDDLNLGRQIEYTFWFWPDQSDESRIAETALFQFDEFLRSCQIDPTGRSYQELEMEPIGHQVIIDMRQELNQQTNRIYTTVGRILGSG